ncbi:MAG TPA: LSM domain-containing protein, partial [Candidatus Bathyarchaeia archaeon]
EAHGHLSKKALIRLNGFTIKGHLSLTKIDALKLISFYNYSKKWRKVTLILFQMGFIKFTPRKNPNLLHEPSKKRIVDEPHFIRLLYLVRGSCISTGLDSDPKLTMMEPSKKPLNVLIKQMHGNIEVVLKNGYEYKGKMIKCDGHMNILLEGATEFKENQLMTNYGNVLLRGNNILYIVMDANKH